MLAAASGSPTCPCRACPCRACLGAPRNNAGRATPEPTGTCCSASRLRAQRPSGPTCCACFAFASTSCRTGGGAAGSGPPPCLALAVGLGWGSHARRRRLQYRCLIGFLRGSSGSRQLVSSLECESRASCCCPCQGAGAGAGCGRVRVAAGRPTQHRRVRAHRQAALY